MIHHLLFAGFGPVCSSWRSTPWLSCPVETRPPPFDAGHPGDELQSLKAGTVLLDTRQSNMTTYVTLDIQTDRQINSQAELSEVKEFQEETYRQTCVNLPIRMESWETVCSPRGRKNMSYDCFNSSVNITNVLMNEEPLSNMCGDSTQFSVVATVLSSLLVLFVLLILFCCFNKSKSRI